MINYAQNNELNQLQTEQLLGSGRTYNIYTYPGQTDNYSQNHYQAHLIRELSSKWKFTLSAHYTKGKGYYEEYRIQDPLASYGISDRLLASDTVVASTFDSATGYSNPHWQSTIQGGDRYDYQVLRTANGDTLFDPSGKPLVYAQAYRSHSDVVRQRWLDNDFYGCVYSFVRRSERSEAVIGGAINGYQGRHFGRLMWAPDAGFNQTNFEYYRGASWKRDWNIYIKSTIALLERLYGFVDVQLRNVYYATSGLENGGRYYHVMDQLTFINPKAGLTWKQNNNSVIYASCAVGNKEPNRNDYIDKAPFDKPKSEQMFDYELGWRNKWFAANLYWMQYKNQLVLNGAVNDVGSALRTNVDRSFRRGVEINAQGSFRLLSWTGSLSLSDNRIQKFNEVIPDYAEGGNQVISRNNTPIAFSPTAIFASQIAFDLLYRPSSNANEVKPSKGLTLILLNRYVGMQYLDNTGQRERTIPSYFVSDIRLQAFKMFGKVRAELSFNVNNALNQSYTANGYTYTYLYGSLINERMYFPQALRNYMLTLQFTL
jgi:iron complex outermembrane receptor protein